MLFPSLEACVFVVGNSRSGTTLVGSLIDAHPAMICANESDLSVRLWRDATREQILQDLEQNVRRNLESDRPSQGYHYGIRQDPKDAAQIRIVGDKIYNPSLLMLHGDPTLVPRLESTLGCPIFFVHVLRNPLDVIATMHRRSGQTLIDRTRWYFMHIDAALSQQERLDGDRWVNLYLEDLIDTPDASIHSVTNLFGLTSGPGYLEACRARLFQKPKLTRHDVAWTRDALDEICHRVERYQALARYAPDCRALAEQSRSR